MSPSNDSNNNNSNDKPKNGRFRVEPSVSIGNIINILIITTAIIAFFVRGEAASSKHIEDVNIHHSYEFLTKAFVPRTELEKEISVIQRKLDELIKESRERRGGN